MKCRMILPVGVLTYLVCFGGVNASAFDWLRLAADEAVLAEPAPIESEDGVLHTTQKSWDSACQKGSACQKSCEPLSLPCRPRLRGRRLRADLWGRTEMRTGQPEGLRPRVPKRSSLPDELRAVRAALPPAVAGLGPGVLLRAGLRCRSEMRPG